MKQIPQEVLFDLDQKITNLPENGRLRRELIRDTAGVFNVSESTIYRQLKKLNIHPNNRKSRSDKGSVRILDQQGFYYYCQVIAALKIASSNQVYMLSTQACIELLESGQVSIKNKNIQAPKGILKPSTINKYLNQYYMSPRYIYSEPTVNHFMARYSNQCWQFDITPSELHKLDEQNSEDPRRLMLFSVVDDNSGISFSKYYYAEGEDTMTALDFLYYSFSKITSHNNELFGIPEFLYTDNGSFIKSKLFQRVMHKIGVNILSHLPRGKGGRKTTSRAKGKVERHHSSVKSILEPMYKLSPPKTLEEANERLVAFTNRYNNEKHRNLNFTKHQAWNMNLPKEADLSMCSYEHYQTLLREPIDRKVKSDASVQISGELYQLDSEFAGETVTILLGLNKNEIYVEYKDKEHGPFFPCKPYSSFGEYDHHNKSSKEEVADNIIVFSRNIEVDLGKITSSIYKTSKNIGNKFISPVKTYSSQIEAKLAIAKHLGKPLATLSYDEINFIDKITLRTLVSKEIITAINDYYDLKLISNEDTL
jgi:hypothetical protein